MKYQLISGGSPRNTTGLHANSSVDTKEGFDWWNEVLGSPLDAPESIPCGAMHRIEWVNSITRRSMSWFPAEIITIRGRQ